jgi:hypothetical protein
MPHSIYLQCNIHIRLIERRKRVVRKLEFVIEFKNSETYNKINTTKLFVLLYTHVVEYIGAQHEPTINDYNLILIPRDSNSVLHPAYPIIQYGQ